MVLPHWTGGEATDIRCTSPYRGHTQREGGANCRLGPLRQLAVDAHPLRVRVCDVQPLAQAMAAAVVAQPADMVGFISDWMVNHVAVQQRLTEVPRRLSVCCCV